MMVKRAVRFSLVAASALGGVLVLGGCESARFGGRGPNVAAARPATVRQAPAELAPVEAIPSDTVTSQPLAPPPGSYPAPATTAAVPTQAAPSQPTVVADISPMPGSPQPIEMLGGNPSAPSGGGGATRASSVGAWTAREASGTSCKVQLSSAPALDLYKASASGCANKDLARVTSWDLRDGEVYLYQPGGAVAARLRSSSGTFEGVLSKSGAPLSLSRS